MPTDRPHLFTSNISTYVHRFNIEKDGENYKYKKILMVITTKEVATKDNFNFIYLH
jgi:hypothetical protein